MSPEMERELRDLYELKLGRRMTDYEVEEFYLFYQQWAEFLLECSRDEELLRKLGIKPTSTTPIDRSKPAAYDAPRKRGPMPVATQKGSGQVGEIVFTIQVFKEGRFFVARSPELDVASQGETLEKAKQHLVEAVEAFVEEAQRMGTLTDVLEESGYERTPEGWKAPDLLAQERARVALPR